MFIYSEPLSGICAYYIFIRGGQVGMELVRPWLEETTLVSGREAKDYWRIWKKKSYVITKNSSMGNDFLFLKMNSSTGEMVLGGKTRSMDKGTMYCIIALSRVPTVDV